MAEFVGVRVSGLRTLNDALDELGNTLKSEVLADALKRGAKPLIARARALAPRGTKNKPPDRELANSIAASTKVGSSAMRRTLKESGAARVLVGPRVPHGHLVEFGHVQVAGRRATTRSARAKRAGQRVVGHVPAHPFMRPAWDATREEVLANIKREIGAALQRKITALKAKADAGRLSDREVRSILRG